MLQVNIHEAKTHLSMLLEKAVNGESFIIAKAGKPMVTVIPYTPEVSSQRVGFMKGQIEIPDDFNHIGKDDLLKMFGGDLSTV